MGLCEASSPVIEGLIFFHDYAIGIIVMILVFVGVLGAGLIINVFLDRYVTEENRVEII